MSSRIRTALAAGLVIAAVAAWPARVGARVPHSTGGSGMVAYISQGSLWVRPLDAKTVSRFRTPWPVTEVVASADRRSLAVVDNRARTAVIDIRARTVRVLNSSPLGSMSALPPVWSPQGNRLAFMTPPGNAGVTRLAEWDRSSGKVITLARDASLLFGNISWSPDGRTVVVARGPADSSIYPVENPMLAAVGVGFGRARAIGTGTDATISPDGRLVAFVRYDTCGASMCSGGQLVRGLFGGAVHRLSSDLSDDAVGDLWARHGSQYIVDRWLLDAKGRPLRRLVPTGERVLAPAPDGSRVAVQTIHPYVAGPFRVSIRDLTGHVRTVLTTASSDSCGACSRVLMPARWSRDGVHLAVLVPGIFQSPKVRVPGALYIAGPGTALTRVSVPIPEAATSSLLGFARGDGSVVFSVGKSIYEYSLAARRVSLLGSNAAPGTAVLAP